MADAKPQLIFMGEVTSYRPILSLVESACEIKCLAYESYDVGEPFAEAPALVICNTPPPSLSTAELAQSLRMNYPDLPLYLVTDNRLSFNRLNMQKNGFTDVYLMPADRKTLEETVRRDVAVASQGALKVFREIQLIDVEIGTELGFDIYLHLQANNKYIKYVSSTDTLNEEKAQRLAKHQINAASISEHQVGEFYKFSAKKLKALGKNDTLTETERIERQERAVRSLLTGIFGQNDETDTFERGKRVLKDCTEIVKSYVAGGSNSWFERFLKISANTNGSYTQAANVSSLACMLSIGLGFTDVEEIGLAGLLHDIGIVEVPPEICDKAPDQRTPEEQSLYEKHPQMSIDMIKNRKMVVSEKVIKIIAQHHENFDGTGYPQKLFGDRICQEAQILHIADEVEKIISAEPGKIKVNPAEAVKKILSHNSEAPGKALVSPELAKKILALFTT